jgi:hypothetical protein
MALVGKSTWIMKTTGGIESATKPKTISHSKRGVLVFNEDQDKTVYRDGAARQNDLF